MSSGSSPASARGAAGGDVDQLDAGGAAQRRHRLGRQRPRSGANLDVGASDAPVAHQRRDQAARVLVDRHGQSQPHAGKRGVDPDDAAVAGRERAAGVSGVQARVRLDHVVDHPQRAAGAGRQRPADGRDHAGRHGPGEPVRIADGDHQLADLQRRRITQLRRMQVAPVDGDHRQVAEGIASDHREAKLPAVGKRRPPSRVSAGTTWAFVMSRSSVSTTAAPPASRTRERERRRTRKFATDGDTRSTTLITARE